jgi:Terminase large subunit, T4likevirus-type, N-terminal
VISKEHLEKLMSRLDTLQPKDRETLFASLIQEILTRCAEDGLFWLKFVNTRDEADPENAIKPFPVHQEYTRQLWTDYTENNPTCVAKSRQMIVSWITCAFCVWTARFKPNTAIYWQTKAWPDAVGMICMPSGGFSGRCQFIEDHLPDWMRLPYKPSEGRIQYPNGSMIQALSGGPDQIRGKTGSLMVLDEFAFQEDQEGVWTAIAPLIQKQAKLIIISTPNGTSNTFATLWHGRPVGEEVPVG